MIRFLVGLIAAVPLSTLAADIGIAWSQNFSVSGVMNSTTLGTVSPPPIKPDKPYQLFDERLGTLTGVTTLIGLTTNLTYNWGKLPNNALLDTTLIFTAKTSILYGVPDVSTNIYSNKVTLCVSCSNYVPGFTLLNARNSVLLYQPFSGDASVFSGGALSFNVTAKTTSGVPVTGTWSTTGRLGETQFYTPRTLTQYVQDAIAISAGTDATRAAAGYIDVIRLREHDSFTSSTNIALRDAEYYLRGYAGGAGYSKSDFTSVRDYLVTEYNNAANKTGPLGAIGYNELKYLKLLYDQNISGNDLPATPPGGILSNASGYLAGKLGVPIDKALQNPLISPAVMTGKTPLNPTAIQHFLDGELDSFYVKPTAGSLLIDPKIRNIASYSFQGNNSVLGFSVVSDLPTDFFLLVNGIDFQMHAGQYFSFADMLGTGVNGFLLHGLPDYNEFGSDLILALTFRNDNEVFINILALDAPRGDVTAVPEPAQWLQMLAGLVVICGLGAKRHLRKKLGRKQRSCPTMTTGLDNSR